ncbi:MAG: HAD family hydrolase [Cephaloticoccus sp.]|nr:HAD family hydrolase [Cephaloticoccus sp.]MCF7760302.1 HAD family hydrolase [Cephaloticoccus sp.]
MTYRTILFDMDGTLVDAFTTLHRAYQHTLPQFGRPEPTMKQVRDVIGGGGSSAMAHFLPDDLVPAALAVHVAYTKTILLEDVKAMPGALELLEYAHARGATLAVYTNKGGEMSRPICDHLGFTPYLTANYGVGDTPWIKPQPEFAAHVLGELKADPNSTLLIGDSTFDIESAHNGGFACWCVTTGTHTEAELVAANADRVLPNLAAVQVALATEM